MTEPKGIVNGLKFNSDGKFRIMQVADIQDTQNTSKDTIEFLSLALQREKPDLVIFTGDQLKGYGVSLLKGDRKENYEKAIRNFLKPVVERKIPFTFVFGNHDDQAFGIPKDEQLKIYQSFDGCLAVAGDESIDGLANHSLTVRDSKNEKTVFNIYLIDSLSTSLDGRCAAVSEGQLEWYKSVRDYLSEQNGGYVKSLLFQHIPMCEMWELLKEVPKGTKPSAQGFREHAGKFYDIDETKLIKGNCDFLLETPATPSVNTGEFDTVSEKGDVIAAFFGHDHNNSFVGRYKGFVMGYTQGCGFNVYGPRLNRGVRIIDLDENNLNTFSTHTTLYSDFNSAKQINNKAKYLLYSYAPPSVESAMPLVKKAAVSAAAAVITAGAAYIIKKKIKNK